MEREKVYVSALLSPLVRLSPSSPHSHVDKSVLCVCVSIAAAAAAAAAAARSLQLCPTLCDPIDGSPPGSPIPGIL